MTLVLTYDINMRNLPRFFFNLRNYQVEADSCNNFKLWCAHTHLYQMTHIMHVCYRSRDSIAKLVLFSVVSVCGCVCLFVTVITLEPFEI